MIRAEADKVVEILETEGISASVDVKKSAGDEWLKAEWPHHRVSVRAMPDLREGLRPVIDAAIKEVLGRESAPEEDYSFWSSSLEGQPRPTNLYQSLKDTTPRR